MAHIWACPPSEGDDYIFHCHPPEQKIPKPKRLQDWYKKMLDIGIKENIVHSYQDILKQAQEDQVKSAMDLPYFEGDFWPNVIEESIKEIEMEQQKQQANDPGSLNSSQSSSQGIDEDSMDTSDCPDKTGNGSDSKDSSSGQKNQKKSGANKKSNKKQNQRKNNTQRNKSGSQVSGQVSLSFVVSRSSRLMHFFLFTVITIDSSSTMGTGSDEPNILDNGETQGSILCHPTSSSVCSLYFA
jgi:E1A/CREB-binding protein